MLGMSPVVELREAESAATVTQLALTFDVCRRKHGGNARSVEANARAHAQKQSVRDQILKLITAADDGMTVAELAEKLGREKNTFSGRLTELHHDKKIERRGDARSGCDVWIAVAGQEQR